MPFKIIKRENINFSTPQEMFQDNKMKNIIGLIDYQSKMIDNYMKTIRDDGSINDKHVAFELPTGSGKTLIGLLIAEFHRRKYHRKALFLCGTNQLVTQVCQQAKNQYGIETIPFCGSQSKYLPTDQSDYLLAKKIGITTYSSFFAVSEYFKNTDILIFDDVHSSECYIADGWSINILRKENTVLYSELAEVFKETAGESFYSRMTSENPYEEDILDWCNMIPQPMIINKIDEISRIISANVKNTTLSYAWSRISDHLNECNIFVSWESILIRPYITPTQSFTPFKNALQCIFMSATLGKSGELERVTGVGKIKTLPIVNNWDKKGIGRKFFLFPDLSFDANQHGKIIVELHKIAKHSVVIVPSMRDMDNVIKLSESYLPNTKIFDANDLITLKEDYKKSRDAMVVIANRFDGIDFPDEESRMLILYNLPKVTHLQEKFLYSKMAASVLYSERVKTRIVQAVGRCTRNAKDYAVVCILGNSILNDLVTSRSLNEYKPEMRAEIQFGIENSTGLTDLSKLFEYVELFLSRDASWAEAEESIVQIRDEYISNNDTPQESIIYEKLHSTAQKEVNLQYILWKKDYKEAFEIITNIISELNAPVLRGYQSFWQYYAGVIGLQIGEEYRNKSIHLFQEAAKGVLGVTWLAQLADFKDGRTNNSEDNFFNCLIERIEQQFLLYKNPARLESVISKILDGITNANGTSFETAQTNLGTLLGYIAANPTEDSTPDPYWIISDDVCIVSEDKIYDSEEKKIPTSHVTQAKRHEDWIRANVPILRKAATVYTYFLSNSQSLEEDARIHAKGIFYCNRLDFIAWSNKAINCLRSCYTTFTDEGNAEWRAQAKLKFEQNEVTPLDFIKLITKRQLNNL